MLLIEAVTVLNTRRHLGSAGWFAYPGLPLVGNADPGDPLPSMSDAEAVAAAERCLRDEAAATADG